LRGGFDLKVMSGRNVPYFGPESLHFSKKGRAGKIYIPFLYISLAILRKMWHSGDVLTNSIKSGFSSCDP
jgi:hypothetical protein